jgi:hypothetical protein
VKGGKNKMRKDTRWTLHVRKTQKENPNLKLSEVLKKAKTTYIKEEKK